MHIDVFPYFTKRISIRMCVCVMVTGEHGADSEETVIEFSWNSGKKISYG